MLRLSVVNLDEYKEMQGEFVNVRKKQYLCSDFEWS